MNDTLLQRQRWFRSFPEGTLEFLLVTRLASVFLLLALGVMREAQRPMVLVVLAIVLLVDYALMIWWAVQMAVDLNMLCGRPDGSSAPQTEALNSDADTGADPCGPRQPVALVALLACLPAIILCLTLAPWPELVLAHRTLPAALTRVLLPVAGVLFLITLVLGYRALRRIRLGPPLWTVLLLVPFVHWFAMHRLLGHMRTRLETYQRGRGETPTEGPILAVPIADVSWFLAVVPWVIVAGLRLAKGLWSNYFPPCGAALVALFAVADVAAMEGFQRHFTAVLRRQGPSLRP